MRAAVRISDLVIGQPQTTIAKEKSILLEIRDKARVRSSESGYKFWNNWIGFGDSPRLCPIIWSAHEILAAKLTQRGPHSRPIYHGTRSIASNSHVLEQDCGFNWQLKILTCYILPTGLEPVTFRLLAECSNQLSYESACMPVCGDGHMGPTGVRNIVLAFLNKKSGRMVCRIVYAELKNSERRWMRVHTNGELKIHEFDLSIFVRRCIKKT